MMLDAISPLNPLLFFLFFYSKGAWLRGNFIYLFFCSGLSLIKSLWLGLFFGLCYV